MQLSLDHIIPIPLKDVFAQRKSDVWNTTLTLDMGQFVFVKAPSGTGKTTLLHQIYGIRKDFEGSVHWGKLNLNNAGPEELAKLRKDQLSIVFQDLRLFPALTAFENIEIKRLLNEHISKEQVAGWMDRLQIGHKKNSLASTLSYGEQQRVAILRALVQPFSWLLMDEPFSHLDQANKHLARALVQEVCTANGAGLVLADLDDNNYFPYAKTLQL